MSKRMMALLAVLLGVGALILLDKPQQSEVLEVSNPVARTELASGPEARPGVAQTMPVTDAIPDLFSAPGMPSEPVAEPPQVLDKAEAAAEPFTLLGFKEEEGVREAYLLRNGEVLLARVGVVLEKRYRVQALQPESVLITDKESGKKIRIGFGMEE